METSDFILLSILTLIAFTVRVVAGFGSAILLSPILSNFFPPKEVVPLIILMETFINAIFIVRERIRFSLAEIYAGSLAGVVIGVFLFGIISHQIAGLIIGTSMCVLSALMLAGFRFRAENERGLFLFLGFISGSMGVLTGVNGPQIILGLTNQGYDAAFVRTFIITYLVIVDTVIFAAFVSTGHITVHTLSSFIVLAPFIALAYIIGAKLVGKVDSETLKRAMLTVVFISSLTLIYRYGGVAVE